MIRHYCDKCGEQVSFAKRYFGMHETLDGTWAVEAKIINRTVTGNSYVLCGYCATELIGLAFQQHQKKEEEYGNKTQS